LLAIETGVRIYQFFQRDFGFSYSFDVEPSGDEDLNMDGVSRKELNQIVVHLHLITQLQIVVGVHSFANTRRFSIKIIEIRGNECLQLRTDFITESI
jgi:hypothetical protein